MVMCQPDGAARDSTCFGYCLDLPPCAMVDTPSTHSSGGLHTPAASDDFSGKTPGCADKVLEFEQQIRSRVGCAQIEPLELQMLPEIADEPQDKRSDERDFKSDLRETGMLVVTYPTDLHESFNTLLSVFSHVADTDTSFVVETNVGLLVPDRDGPSKRLPDLVFGKKSGRDALPEYGIVVECGYSQDTPDLAKKARMWFRFQSIQAVVTLKFECAKYARPRVGTKHPKKAVDFATDWDGAALLCTSLIPHEVDRAALLALSSYLTQSPHTVKRAARVLARTGFPSPTTSHLAAPATF
ncbi:hypothetical protein C8J57DRAFT_1517394 [Mycena rebaudengoi]|nr:hypothetical protein C8J57DRAFT_1517394 [Mycena rebaudengoi]